MRRVERPVFSPQICAVTLRGQDDDWFDTGTDLRGIDPRVYVSGAGCRLAAQAIGWHAPEVVEERDGRIAALERELSELQLQLREADKVIDAIDVFESRGFTTRKKPGRPPSKAAA
jgi:hypothetical protein